MLTRVLRSASAALLAATLSAALADAAPWHSASPLPRRWDATVVVNGIAVPFPFEITRRGDVLVGSFFNGSRRVNSTASRLDDDRIVLTFAQYGATLEVSASDNRLTGHYRRGEAVYPFSAVPAATRRVTGVAAPPIGGTWIVEAHSSKGEAAWRFIVRQDEGRVSATILRVDGDTGTLTGSFDGERFVLSHFSGVRPLLLEVFPRADGTLDLRRNGRAELLRAVREGDPRASAIGTPSDPDSHTTVRDAAEPFRFSFPDLSGRVVSNTDPQFAGKVVLVSVSGSWCPNCHDEAPFLESLYRKYRDHGFEMVTLSFEEKDQLANPERLRAFIATYGFRHTILLAGEPDQVTEKVPQAVNLNAFPTSFILGRDGRVRAVHAGFPSPGSGAFYRRAEQDVSREIERLLAEKPEVTR